jgi:hypothetical protein
MDYAFLFNAIATDYPRTVIRGNNFVNCIIEDECERQSMAQCFGDNNHCFTNDTLPFCECGQRGMLPDGIIVEVQPRR